MSDELVLGPGAPVADRAPRWRWRALVASPQGAIGVVLLAGFLLLILVGPLLAPDDPYAISADTGAGPSAAHPLGTDTLGRDILSRVLTGGGSMLLFPLATMALALTVATVLGVLAGYLGGTFDAVTTRIFDVQLAIPGMLLALVVISGFGRGDGVVVAAVALVAVPRLARVLRAATQAVAPREYVLAARARGEPVWWIAFGEILPSILPTLLVEAALALTAALLSIAALSFLGLGVQAPTSNWAVMVSENRSLLFTHPWGGVLIPALLIAGLATAINLVADGLTGALGRRELRR